MTDKKYIITEDQRQETIQLINERSLLAAKNLLNQLEELNTTEENKDGM